MYQKIQGKVKREFMLFLTAVVLTVLFGCSVAQAAESASVKLSKSRATVVVGNTLQLKAAVTGKSQKVVWNSSKKSVATVSAKGKVTACKAGIAVITAKANGKTAKCTITVKNPAKPSIKSWSAKYSGGASSFTADGSGYIRIKAAVTADKAAKTTITVKNAKNKIVYQKSYKAAKKTAVNLKWTGKASANNKAGLKAGSYVSAGSYKLQLTSFYTCKNEKYSSSKTVTVKVAARTADSSAWKNVSWTTTPYLTGDLEADYMAECICQKVLTTSMSKETQMKKLYEYVVKLSIHYGSGKQKGKINFKLNSAATREKMASYESYWKKLRNSGKAKDLSTIKGYEWHYYVGAENNFFQTGEADCGITARAYQVLLGHIGVQSFIFNSTGPGGQHHLWNGVLYKGKYYAADPDAENDNYVRLVNNGKLAYAFYMKGRKTMEAFGHVFPSSYPTVSRADANL